MALTTLVFGQGGIGKSYITLDLAARMSAGTPWPGENEHRAPEKVLIFAAEDDLSRVLIHRLMACRADLNNISGAAEPFTLDRDGLAYLREQIVAFGAKLVIIDPMVQYMGGKVDINKANEVRTVMGELQQLAMELDCAILLVHHVRKGSEGATWERVIGSGDFYNAVRSGLYVNVSSDGGKVMSHAKSQYGPSGLARGFTVTEDGITWGEAFTDTGDVKRPRVSKVAQVRDSLRDVLQGGSIPATMGMARMFELGHAEASINRAKVGLVRSVLKYDQTGTRAWYWELAEESHDGK
jgi:DNA repair protein RadA/Sms